MSLLYATLPLLLMSFGILAAVCWYRARPLDPFEFKTKQAAKLKWKQSGAVNKDGEAAPFAKRCVRFVRGTEEAVLWHKDADVTLVRLNVPFEFDDFLELEEFLKTHPRETDDATSEIKYLREMDLFFVRNGYRDDMMHIQATDYDFFVALMKLYKTGYAAGVESLVIAPFVLHALQFYAKDRKRTLRWLSSTTEDFLRDGSGLLA
jgi:hypothetical protein